MLLAMPRVLKAAAVGAVVALVTGAVGFLALTTWGGERTATGLAYVGVTFTLPLMLARSWVIAGLVHWAACTLLILAVSWASTSVRRRTDAPMARQLRLIAEIPQLPCLPK